MMFDVLCLTYVAVECVWGLVSVCRFGELPVVLCVYYVS